MSTIERIGNALRYDAVEVTLMKGTLADALALACLIAENSPIGDDTAPESARTELATLFA